MSENLISREQAGNDVLAAAAYLAQHIRSSDGHAEAMKAVVPRYLERGEVDLAAELANAIEDPFTRDRLLIGVAEKCAEIGDYEYGLQLADVIEDVGMQSQARERIAIRMADACEFDRASEVAEQIVHPDYAYAEIAVGLAKSGLEQESEEAIGRIELPVARVSVRQGIAAWHRENGNNAAAAASLENAVSTAQEIEHGEEKVRALGEIANSIIDCGRKDLAISTYEIARDESESLTSIHRDLFLSGIAIGFLKADNIDLADNTLDLVSDKTQLASGLLGFARMFWETGEKDEALEALEESRAIAKSQREAEVRDSRAANTLAGLIAAQFALFGKPERAIEIAQESSDENERANLLASIAQIATMTGDDEAALQSISGISEESSRASALIGIAEAHAKLGEREKAIASLDEAVQLAADLPQPAIRTSLLETAAVFYSQNGSSDKTRQAVLAALWSIASIRNDSDRAVAVALLSDVYRQSEIELGEKEKDVIGAILQKTLW